MYHNVVSSQLGCVNTFTARQSVALGIDMTGVDSESDQA